MVRERGRNNKLQGVTQAKEAYKCQIATFIQEKQVSLLQCNICFFSLVEYLNVRRIKLKYAWKSKSVVDRDINAR